jgi:hypothetical protein
MLLVRDQAKASIVKTQLSTVETVQGSLEDARLLEAESALADVIIRESHPWLWTRQGRRVNEGLQIPPTPPTVCQRRKQSCAEPWKETILRTPCTGFTRVGLVSSLISTPTRVSTESVARRFTTTGRALRRSLLSLTTPCTATSIRSCCREGLSTAVC